MITTAIVVCLMSFVCTWKGEAQMILQLIVEVQGAVLRRFNKHKKMASLWGEYPPVMNFTIFVECNELKYGLKLYCGSSLI